MDRLLIRLAATLQRQHGCLSREEIINAGFTPRQVQHRVGCGLLVPVSRGVYRSITSAETGRSMLWAAHLALPNSVASHRSAAWWLDFADEPTSPELSIPMTTNGAPIGVIVHRRRLDLGPWTIKVDGLRVTRPEVTVLEMASQLTDDAFTALVDRYAAGSRRRLDKLSEWFDEVCGQGRPGTARARRELERRVAGDYASSRLERLFLQVIDASALPRPTLQWTPPWNRGVRVDAAYVEARLIIELDGHAFHANPTAFEADRRRDQVATTHGWTTLRFTWAHLRDEPDRVVDVIAAALAIRRTGR